MKIRSLVPLIIGSLAFASLVNGLSVQAGTITKADNTNALGTAESWVGGVAPTSTDIANWSGAYSASYNNTTFLTNSLRAVNSGSASAASTLSWQGISVGTLSGTALTTNTIYWGTTGFGAETNLSAATQSGNIVTITTKANHGYVVGQSVTIAGVTPAGYNGTYTIIGIPSATQFTYWNATTGLGAGTAFGTVESSIYIGGAGGSAVNSAYIIGSAGIDLSAASHSVSLTATGFAFAGNQTWTTASGRVIRFGGSGVSGASAKAVSSGTDGLIDISGTGFVDANQGGSGGMADAGGFTGFTGKWRVNSGATLRGLRNGATAWGSNPGADSITLNGGTLAVGGPSGAVGNWTWTNGITLASGTTSAIDNQNVTGNSRYLKLNDSISGSGNLVFKDTLLAGTFSSPDLGFILTGANIMSGTVTIGGPTENGIAGRLSYVRVGGIGGDSVASGIGADGSLGTATIVNNGILTFSLNTSITVNTISGTGSLRVGYTTTAGAESQNVTLTGVNTYSGYTRVNMGTLTLPAGASIPNTSDIFLTPFTTASLTTVTLDVTQNGGLTLNSGQRLVGGANNASLNNTAQVSGNVTAGTGSAIVPGGTNVANTLVINGNLTLTGGATLVYDVGNTTATSDLITVANLNPSGVTTFAVTPPGTGLFAGTYPLIQVSGALNGTPANFAITGLSAGPRGQTFSIVYDTTTPGAYTVNLVVVGSPGALVWQGNGVNNNWDAGVTKDWSNTVSSASDFFYPGDLVTFDDTGLNTPAVNLVGVVRPGTLTINALQNYTFSGAGQIAGLTGLAVSNSGTLTLLTSNSFTGPIMVTGGGIVAITNETALNQPITASAQALTLDNGGALLVTNNVTIGANTNRGIIIGTGGGTLTVTNGATLTVSNVIGDLTGVSVLTKTGDGTLKLNGRNNYGGGSIIDGGSVICGNANALGMNGSSGNGIFSAGFTLKSGTLDLNGWGNYASTNTGVGTNYLFFGVFITFEGNPGATMNFIDSTPGHAGFGVAPSASGTVISYNGVNNPGKAVISAPWYTVGTGAYPRTYGVQVDPTTASPVGLEFQGQMSSLSYEGKVATIQKTGEGIMEISCTNYYPIMQVTAGTLLVNNQYALGADRSPNYPNPFNPTIGVGTGSSHQLIVDGGTVDLNGYSPAIGALSDNGGFTTGVITNGGATPSVLTLGYSVSNIVNHASYAGIIAGGGQSLSVVKIGTNTQALAGLNTYTGTTTVSNGVLRIDGQVGPGAVTVGGGALGGMGTVNASVAVLAGGTLEPAAGTNLPVTLTAASGLTLASGSFTVMNVDKTAGTNDQVVLSGGTLNYGGTLVVSNQPGTYVLGDSFKLFTAPGSSGAFAGVVGSPGAGLGWSFNPASGVVTVVTGIPTTPTNLTAVVSGSNLEVSWPSEYTGWQLQVQTNGITVGISNNWSAWAGSTTTNRVFVPIVPSNPSVFLRLMYPPQ